MSPTRLTCLKNSCEFPKNPFRHRCCRATIRKPVRNAAVELLRIVAHHGHAVPADAEAAFHAGLKGFGKWGESCAYNGERKPSTAALDKSLDVLVALNGEGRKMLLGTVTTVVLHDEQLTVPEAELIRAICASLEIPLPPQIGVSLNSNIDSGSD